MEKYICAYEYIACTPKHSSASWLTEILMGKSRDGELNIYTQASRSHGAALLNIQL